MVVCDLAFIILELPVFVIMLFIDSCPNEMLIILNIYIGCSCIIDIFC